MPELKNTHQPLRLGFVGASPNARFVMETTSLRSDFQIVAAWDPDSSNITWPHSVSRDQVLICHSMKDMANLQDIDVLFFACQTPPESILQAIDCQKHCIIEAPQRFSLDELNQIASVSNDTGPNVVTFGTHRWTDDFRRACQARSSGRLGTLVRLRYLLHDYKLPQEEFPLGVGRELGSPIVDQMMQLVDSAGTKIDDWKVKILDEGPHEFLTVCQFQNRVTVIIEIQTKSLSGFRSGWIVEGTEGAYRAGRMMTRTKDGEIVDEPVDVADVTNDAYCDALRDLASSANRKSQSIGSTPATNSFPTIHDAVRVATLLDQ